MAFLKSMSYNPRYHDVKEEFDQTLEWLWEEGRSGLGFVEWLKSGDGIYWISGKPGSGKSTLMKYALRDARLKQHLSQEDSLLLDAWFFFELGRDTETEFSSLLCHMLHILFTRHPSLASHLLPLIKDDGAGNILMRQIELEEALLEISTRTDICATACFFIDALDECNCKYREEIEFLQKLVDPTTSGSLKYKFCISSRNESAIQSLLEKCPGFRIQDFTAKDISEYVSIKLSKTTDKDYTRKIDQGLVQEVVGKASGVFLWVRLVVEDLIEGLENGDSDEELFGRLSELPQDLEDLYSRIVQKIPPKYLHDTIHYFELIDHKERYFPLFLLSFAEEGVQKAIDCPVKSYTSLDIHNVSEVMERRVRSRCRNLLWIEKSDDERASVGFVHRTVREWIMKEQHINEISLRALNKSKRDYNVGLMAASFRLLKISSRAGNFGGDFYMAQRTALLKNSTRKSSSPNEHRKRLIGLPAGAWTFNLFWAIANCLRYVRQAESTTSTAQSSLLKGLSQLCNDVDKSWVKSYADYRMKLCMPWYRHRADFSDCTFLSIAIMEHLNLFVEAQVLSSPKFSPLDFGPSPLFYAITDHVEQSKLEIFKVLFRYGANVNEICFGEIKTWHFLLDNLSTIFLCYELVNLFLKEGADPFSAIRLKIHTSITPLGAVFRRIMKEDEEIGADAEAGLVLMRLLDAGVDPLTNCINNSNAIEIASQLSPSILSLLEKYTTEEWRAKRKELRQQGKIPDRAELEKQEKIPEKRVRVRKFLPFNFLRSKTKNAGS
jgi:hypothetical protein